MPDHAVEVTANWELYTGSEPTVFWEYYTYSGLLTPDNTPQDPADMSNMTVSYDSASRTYTVDLKDDLWSSVEFQGNEIRTSRSKVNWEIPSIFPVQTM